MMTDLESRLSQSLRERAPVEAVDTGALLGAAQSRGRKLARRRQVTAVAAIAAALVVVLGGSVAAVPLIFGDAAQEMAGDSPDGAPAQSADPSTVPAGSARGVPMLPTTGTAGAAKQVPLVGSDPTALHFALVDVDTSFVAIRWSTKPGLETMELSRTAELYTWVTVSPDKRVLDTEIRERIGTYRNDGVTNAVKVGDLPGELRTIPTTEGVSFLLQWQPVPGLWTNIHVRTGAQADVWSLVPKLRFDVAQRCVAPASPSTLPEGFTLVGCDVFLLGSRYPMERSKTTPWFGSASLRYTNGRGTLDFIVRPIDALERLPSPAADRSIVDKGEAVAVDVGAQLVVELWPNAPFAEPVKQMIDGITVTPALDDLSRWPDPIR